MASEASGKRIHFCGSVSQAMKRKSCLLLTTKEDHGGLGCAGGACKVLQLNFFFFLMWTIFEVFIGFVTRLLLFYVLIFWPWGMWDLSSQTRDWTLTPYTGRQSLNHWTTREVPPAYLRVVWCGPTLFDLLSENSFKFCFCLNFCICILQPFSKVEDNSCPVSNLFFFLQMEKFKAEAGYMFKSAK